MGIVAYLGADHHMFNKTDMTCQQVNLGTVASGCCVDPVCGYQILSSYFYVSQVSRQTYIEMQPGLFEDFIENRHQSVATTPTECNVY